MQLSHSKAEPGIACILGPLQTDNGHTVKTYEGVESGNKNTENDGNTGIAPLGATPGSPLSIFCLASDRLGLARLEKSAHRPTLNIEIIPWRRMGHTALVFKAEYQSRVQSWVQYRMQSCIQSCAGVKKRL